MSPGQTDKQKRALRYGLVLDVQVKCPFTGDYTLKSRNLSETGIFLDKGEQPLPEAGTIVVLRVANGLQGDDAPPVEARVVRITDDGMGLEFLQD